MQFLKNNELKQNSTSKKYQLSHSKLQRKSLKSKLSQTSSRKVSASHSKIKSNALFNPSSNLKNKLITFLTKTAQIQRKLQIIKQTLSQQQTFTPESLFNRIDTQRKGFILQYDLQAFMRDNKMEFKGAQLKILYGKMNVDKKDSGVKLWEFQNFILPNQNPRLRYLTMRRPVYIPLQNQRLEQKQQWLLSKLFFQIMKQQTKLRQINVTLVSSYDFNPAHIFNLIADSKQFITGESLNSFFYRQNCEVPIQQIGCIMRLIDKHGQGRICLDDFKHYLATLGLKKEHQIFDELSPIPALKNFVVPLVSDILGIRQSRTK